MSMDVAPNSVSPSYTPTDGGAREGEATETVSPLESPRLGSISPRGGQSPRKMGSVLTTSERARADGRQQLVCTSPPAPGGGETVVVRVTNNGQDFTSAEFTTNVGFTYYRYEDDDE